MSYWICLVLALQLIYPYGVALSAVNDCAQLVVQLGGAQRWSDGEIDASQFDLQHVRHSLLPVSTKGPSFCQGFPPNSDFYLRENSTDMQIANSIFVYHEFRWLDELFKGHPPHTILDLGANTGLASLYFSKRFPGARIASVEASLDNYKMLAINCQRLANVMLMHAAVWNESMYVHIMHKEEEEWGFAVEATQNVASAAAADVIPALTVPEIMAKLHWNHITYLKMDVEGAEIALFSDPHKAALWLSKVHYISMELHERFFPGCDEAANNAMSAAGFEHIMDDGDLAIYRNTARHQVHRTDVTIKSGLKPKP